MEKGRHRTATCPACGVPSPKRDALTLQQVLEIKSASTAKFSRHLAEPRQDPTRTNNSDAWYTVDFCCRSDSKGRGEVAVVDRTLGLGILVGQLRVYAPVAGTTNATTVSWRYAVQVSPPQQQYMRGHQAYSTPIDLGRKILHCHCRHRKRSQPPQPQTEKSKPRATCTGIKIVSAANSHGTLYCCTAPYIRTAAVQYVQH